MSSSTKKYEESCCLSSYTLHGRHHFHTVVSDVVGGHYINATKQTQQLTYFRLIIVLVSLRVATRYLDKFYICFREFIELQDGITNRKSCPGKKIMTRFARATVTKSFQRTSGNTTITGLRKAAQTSDLH